MKRSLPLMVAAAMLGGCALTPPYERPSVPQPAAFKEDGPWRQARPGLPDAQTPWWQAYGDPTLEDLIQQALQANQTLRQSEAQLRQAQALARQADAAWWPTVGANVQAQRERTQSQAGSSLYDVRSAALQASWEPDFWGKVRASTDAADATARASAGDLAAARLALQASVVTNYAQLRVDDSLLDTYARTLAGYREALQIAESQVRAGTATPADVELARSTLASAEAQSVDLALSRSQSEHALAVLLGKAPADFHLDAAPLQLALPVAPPLLPSQLLERRPDIAAAEARVQAANAKVGESRAAWFPNLAFSASGGSTAIGLWASAPARVWALGAALTGTLFDGGLRRAQTAQAEAGFDQTVAAYRQTVLASFQEVEDNLAALRELARERELLARAVASARESERVLLRQYGAGTSTYTAVITAQALTLANERSLVQIQGRELTASVALVKALGGGYAQPSTALTKN